DSKGFITVNGTDILGDGNISFGLVLDYGQNILRTTNDDEALDANGEPCEQGRCDGSGTTFPADGAHGIPSLVENSFQGTFSFNYGIANAAVVGLSVPVVLMTGDPGYDIGPDPEIGGANYNTAP